MAHEKLKRVALSVIDEMDSSHGDQSHFREISSKVERSFVLRDRVAQDSRDQEWQRVNSYIADVLKDSHVMYSKLIRLQGDFIGKELEQLDSISDDALKLGRRLADFMQAFHEGEVDMKQEKIFGQPGVGGPPMPSPEAGAEGGAPPPSDREEAQFEEEMADEDSKEFEDFSNEDNEEEKE